MNPQNFTFVFPPMGQYVSPSPHQGMTPELRLNPLYYYCLMPTCVPYEVQQPQIVPIIPIIPQTTRQPIPMQVQPKIDENPQQIDSQERTNEKSTSRTKTKIQIKSEESIENTELKDQSNNKDQSDESFENETQNDSDYEPQESNSFDKERRGKGHLWTEEEQKELFDLYHELKGDWKAISESMGNRSISQCSQKFRKIMKDKYKKKKHKWTEAEDDLLMKGVQKYGRDWMKIAEDLEGRNCKQVRDRYINKLDPQLTDRPWTDQEDKKLLELYKQQGKKWTLFSKILKGRSENQVKNRFYYRIKKKYLKNSWKYQ